MPCEKELQELAMVLRKGSRYFKGWNINVLQAFIRDRGCCVYCGKPLLEKFGVAGTGDHLLPKCDYPDLAENVDNLVPACAECEHIKHYYDPSKGKGKELVITEQVRRLSLIPEAQREIERRTKANDWKKEFDTAKRLFDDAVEEYRKCKESAAAAA
jgi:hypothetical protein